MPLFLVTGLPGSGKSTVWRELKARGYEAYDGDKDHIAYWYNNKTGLPVKRWQEKRTPEFVQTHWRGVAREKIEDLAAKAKDKTVFLCNDPQNEDELRDLFAKVFALFVDEETLKQRLATRTGNAWGKSPHELAFVLASQQKAEADCKKFGYIAIDAAQPVEVIVDRIVEEIYLLLLCYADT